MHRRALAAVAVAALAVLAGCSGLVEDVDRRVDDLSREATPDAGPAATPTATARSPPGSDAASPTATPADASLSGDNPWGQRVVPVAVNDTVRDGRNTTAVVARAIDYWNPRVERYTPFDYRFRLVEDRSAARLEVRFVDEISECDGPTNHTHGCAPVLREGTRAPETETARVVSNGSNARVLTTTKHELGHVLGLGHTDSPLVIMGNASAGPIPDASTRTNAFLTDALNVYVDTASIDGDERRIERQVGHAVTYYDDGAAGTVPRNVSFERTDRAVGAEILVTNDPDRGCEVTDGSGRIVDGSDPDQDGELERYYRATICVDVDEDASGWWVGYWLGRSMGLAESELAAPFQSQDYDDRRSDWWD